jgi:hypothetical protein
LMLDSRMSARSPTTRDCSPSAASRGRRPRRTFESSLPR